MFEPKPIARRILDDPGGGDAPTGVARAAFGRRHRARRIDRVLKGRPVTRAGCPLGGDATAGFEHDQQIFDRPVVQRVGQHDPFADQFVALRIDHDDIALGGDLTGLAPPHDAVGGEVIAFARHAQKPTGPSGDDFPLDVIFDQIGAEIDCGLASGGARRLAGALACLGEGGAGQCQNKRQRRPANNLRSQRPRSPIFAFVYCTLA